MSTVTAVFWTCRGTRNSQECCLLLHWTVKAKVLPTLHHIMTARRLPTGNRPDAPSSQNWQMVWWYGLWYGWSATAENDPHGKSYEYVLEKDLPKRCSTRCQMAPGVCLSTGCLQVGSSNGIHEATHKLLWAPDTPGVFGLVLETHRGRATSQHFLLLLRYWKCLQQCKLDLEWSQIIKEEEQARY